MLRKLWIPWICLQLIACCLAVDPVIVEEPDDVTVRQGDDVTLRCVVDHLPGEDENPVQWTRENFGMGSDRNMSNWDRYFMVGNAARGEYNLLIKNANVVEDDNIFECQVTMYVLRSRKAKVTVQVPPIGPTIDHIQSDDITVNAVADEENAITCRAHGAKPAAELSWFRNGVEIVEGVTSVVTGTPATPARLFNTTSTLRITPGFDDVDATYACVMKSVALDQVQSKMVRLNVQKPPIVSVSLPPSIQAGDDVTVECRAMADPPVLQYRWYVNGQDQSDESSSSFVVKDIDKTWHEVIISCQARNEAGYSKKSQLSINVKYPPRFINGSSPQTVEIGENVNLSCEWDSNPGASVDWVREGETRVLATGGTVTLHNVTQNDAAIYVCRATAKNVGGNSARIELRVRGAPLFSSAPRQHVAVGEDALVNCELKSDPGIDSVTWTWEHKDRAFTLTGNQTLTSSGDVIAEAGDVKYQGLFKSGDRFASLLVKGASSDDLHSYTCAVANGYGTNSLSIELTEDSIATGGAAMLGVAIGAAFGGVVLLVIIIVVMLHCVKARRQRKSTNFELERANVKSAHKNAKDAALREFAGDESVPIFHEHQKSASGDYQPRSSISSQVGGREDSVDGSDDTNPTPTSGNDDGYHTEEAHSWNRTDHQGKASSLSAASPAKSSSVSNGASGYPGSYHHLPPHPEQQELPPHHYAGDYSSYNDFHPSMSPQRHNYNHYDPNSFAPGVRSASALADRLSPPPNRYVNRKHSDVSAPASSSYSIAPPPSMDYYPNFATLPAGEPMYFGPSPDYGGNRTTPIPQSITSADPYYQHQMGGGSSESSLDKIERGSTLSASAAAMRSVDPNMARMTMSSRMSQSSRSSDFLRPLATARMATHV